MSATIYLKFQAFLQCTHAQSCRLSLQTKTRSRGFKPPRTINGAVHNLSEHCLMNSNGLLPTINHEAHHLYHLHHTPTHPNACMHTLTFKSVGSLVLRLQQLLELACNVAALACAVKECKRKSCVLIPPQICRQWLASVASDPHPTELRSDLAFSTVHLAIDRAFRYPTLHVVVQCSSRPPLPRQHPQHKLLLGATFSRAVPVWKLPYQSYNSCVKTL